MNIEMQECNPEGRRFSGCAATMSATFAAATRADDASAAATGQRDRSVVMAFSRLPPLNWPSNLYA
jgi:hypothetical protein